MDESNTHKKINYISASAHNINYYNKWLSIMGKIGKYNTHQNEKYLVKHVYENDVYKVFVENIENASTIS